MMAVLGGASRIVAVDISQKALDKAVQLGATDTIRINDSKEPPDSVRNRLCTILPDGVDLAIDAAGFAATCEYAVWCARRAGRVVQVGLPIGGRPPHIPMGRVAGWELEIVGSHGFAATDLPDLLDLVASGKLQPELLVEECVSLRTGIETLTSMDKTSPLGMTVITDFGQEGRSEKATISIRAQQRTVQQPSRL